MSVEPAQLVLGLLGASSTGTLSAAKLGQAGALFGFAPGTVRVALTRLRQRRLIRAVERGVYALADEAVEARQDVVDWRQRGEAVTEWSGDWIALSTAGVDRRDRTAGRLRDRALLRQGFAKAAPGLEIRPDNRRQALDELRLRLAVLAPGALVFRASDLPLDCVDRALEVWQPAALDEAYESLTQALETAEAKLRKLGPGPAAALAFEVGDRAIRAIVADPLLPAAFVDVDARDRFFATMRRFDEVGRRLWHDVLTEVAA